MAYLLGIDGGGTKTHGALYDTVTGRLKIVEGGCTSHEQLADGVDGAILELQDIVSGLTSSMDIEIVDIEHQTFGMAGIDTRYQLRMIEDGLRKIGFWNFTLCNDAFLGIQAAISDGVGICLVNGTGFNIVGINEHDEMFQSGSQFELTGDYGGGLILGKEVVKTVYLNLYRERRDTVLNNMLMSELGVNRKEDFIETISKALHEGQVHLPALAKLFFDAANKGDKQSMEVLRRVGREYAFSVKTLLEELPFDRREIDIVLVGSLFTKKWNEISTISLEKTLAEILPEYTFRLQYLTDPPVYGALIWSYRKIFGRNFALSYSEMLNQTISPRIQETETGSSQAISDQKIGCDEKEFKENL